jgi:signal transduction histidine kinase
MWGLVNQFRIRFILGSVFFLLGLTITVVLVVRDSLLFSARNTSNIGAEALLDLSSASLLEIAQREAELSDHAVHHNPSDFMELNQRLRTLNFTPGSFAFIVDAEGRLVAASSTKVGNLFGARGSVKNLSWQGYSLMEVENADLLEIILQMQAGNIGTTQIEINEEVVVIAYAPLKEMGWSLAIIESVEDISRRTEPLSESIHNETNQILQATLLTIGSFSILVIIVAVLVARALTGPIQQLVEGTHTIAEGDLSVRIPIKSRDELGMLAESFNLMADSLQALNLDLMEANQAAIENARLYEQARTLVTVEERQRLARELHDSVTQSLYSLMLLAEASRRSALGNDVEKSIEYITRLGELAHQALKEMRLLVYELRPLALEQAGLIDAMQHRLDAVEKRAGVDTHLSVDLDAHLPADVEAELYRIAQEALNNSLKHANANSISVILRSHDYQVEMDIVDDGRGFTTDALDDLGGLGLVSIYERVEALGGQVTITSKPGQGTQVKIKITVNQAYDVDRSSMV